MPTANSIYEGLEFIVTVAQCLIFLFMEIEGHSLAKVYIARDKINWHIPANESIDSG